MGAVPDVAPPGKPMANGHRAGNPASRAAAMAVLQKIEAQDLVASARRGGAHARVPQTAPDRKHEAIGDVRGSGLIFGAELITDRAAKAAAATGNCPRRASARPAMTDEGLTEALVGVATEVLTSDRARRRHRHRRRKGGHRLITACDVFGQAWLAARPTTAPDRTAHPCEICQRRR